MYCQCLRKLSSLRMMSERMLRGGLQRPHLHWDLYNTRSLVGTAITRKLSFLSEYDSPGYTIAEEFNRCGEYRNAILETSPTMTLVIYIPHHSFYQHRSYLMAWFLPELESEGCRIALPQELYCGCIRNKFCAVDNTWGMQMEEWCRIGSFWWQQREFTSNMIHSGSNDSS